MDLLHLLDSLDSETDTDSSEEMDEEEYDDQINDALNYIYAVRVCQRGTRHSIENFVENVVPNYTENEFLSQFRIGSNVCEQLIEKFEDSDIYKKLFSTTGGRQPISAEKHILTFLYFVGHEAAGYRAVNNIFNITISTLYSVLNRVAEFICSLGGQIIKWPNHEEMVEIKSFFQNHKGIPNVVGAIDGSHIRIDKPVNDPESYINRNNDYTIQMQGIVNNEKKFIDIFIGYPGSVHDARVLENSPIFNTLPNICEGSAGGYILGDSAYPTLECLMVPYKDDGHLNDVQKKYNFMHSSAHICVEHAFGLLKQRFRQLYHLKLRKPKLIVQIIKSCCILHNMANLEEISLLENPMEEIPDIDIEDDEEIEDTETGKRKRNDLAQFLWANPFIPIE